MVSSAARCREATRSRSEGGSPGRQHPPTQKRVSASAAHRNLSGAAELPAAQSKFNCAVAFSTARCREASCGEPPRAQLQRRAARRRETTCRCAPVQQCRIPYAETGISLSRASQPQRRSGTSCGAVEVPLRRGLFHCAVPRGQPIPKRGRLSRASASPCAKTAISLSRASQPQRRSGTSCGAVEVQLRRGLFHCAVPRGQLRRAPAGPAAEAGYAAPRDDLPQCPCAAVPHPLRRNGYQPQPRIATSAAQRNFLRRSRSSTGAAGSSAAPLRLRCAVSVGTRSKRWNAPPRSCAAATELRCGHGGCHAPRESTRHDYGRSALTWAGVGPPGSMTTIASSKPTAA